MKIHSVTSQYWHPHMEGLQSEWNTNDSKMGFGSEGSLVLKHHDQRTLFSNKDLEVRVISLKTPHPWQNVLRKCSRRLQRDESGPLPFPPASELSPNKWLWLRSGGLKYSRQIGMWLKLSNSWIRLTRDTWQSRCGLQRVSCHFVIKLDFQEIKLSSHLLFRYFGIFNVR